eukprot:m.295355 g.295355  ORF g.295355 m.295355 type:complete len:161 (-) comp19512_c0_seq13:1228-1710(-)
MHGMFRVTLLVVVLAAASSAVRSGNQPNIVFIMTDDQDTLLGGKTPMNKSLPVLAKRGATLTNWVVHTPVCCPSRSEVLTGRYFHNLARTPVGRWDVKEPSGMAYQCMHINETRLSPGPTFAKHLGAAGYEYFTAAGANGGSHILCQPRATIKVGVGSIW